MLKLPSSSNAMLSPVLTEAGISDASKALSSQNAPSVAGLSVGMDASVSKLLSVPQLPEASQTVDLTSPALIEELRGATDVEDLTGQFEHARRNRVARGGYSEVYMAHWKCGTKIPVC